MTDITDDQIRAHRETEHPIGQCWCDVALGDRTFAHTTIEEARRRVASAIKRPPRRYPVMTMRELNDMIRRLKNLSQRADLTGDGWHWLQSLIRERDQRNRNAMDARAKEQP